MGLTTFQIKRFPEELKALLKIKAIREGKTLAEYSIKVLSEAVKK